MAWTENSSPQRTLRSIALFEGFKGLAALTIGLGLLELLHHDLRQLVLEFVGHFGLDPNQPFPALMLHYADVLNHTPLATLELLLGAYLAILHQITPGSMIAASIIIAAGIKPSGVVT